MRIPVRSGRFKREGDWRGFRDAHIEPDWLLIYRVAGHELHLARTGAHADIFD